MQFLKEFLSGKGLTHSFGHTFLRFSLLSFLLIAPLTAGIILTQHQMFESEAARYCESRLRGLRTAFDHAQRDYAQLSRIILEQVVYPTDAAALLAEVQRDPQRADVVRQELFQRINPAYQKLRRQGVKQLHFHLPDNHSFLRMHQPDRFGDDLTEIRSTVRLANQKKQVVTGFEEGRIFNGFRYVYPLTYQNQHVGTVEISASSSNIIARIASEMDLVHFVMRKDIVRDKVFKGYQDHYRKTPLSDMFLVEDNDFVQSHSLQKMIPGIKTDSDRLQLKKILAQLINTSGKAGHATWYKNRNETFLLAYLPVFNADGQSVAAIVGVERNIVLADLYAMGYWQIVAIVVCSVALIFGIALLGTAMRRARVDAIRTRELNSRIEQADRTKSAFLANMSHEIRTPLTAILGYSEMLQEQIQADDIDSEYLEVLGVISHSGEHLHAIVNDILDLSKIEAGQLTVEKTSFSLIHVLYDVEKMMKGQLANRPLKLTISAKTSIPDQVQSDPTRLTQILLKLLGNAVKFTQKGQIDLLVSVDETGGKKTLRFEVRDTGVGMTPQQISKLFQPFSQADDTASRKFGGTGLGLNISRRLARLMSGDVTLAYSRVEEGSSFVLELPLILVPGVQWITDLNAACAAYGKTLAALAKKGQARIHLAGHILLAEDDPCNQMLVAYHLRKAGAEVTIADNGVIALQTLQEAAERGEPFDLLLTDVQMPEMDGRELARTLRKRGQTLPIIALTAHAIEVEIQACLDAGCDGYASKPIDKTRLLQDCKKWMRQKKKENQSKVPNFSI